MEKFTGQQAGVVFNQKVIDSVAAAHGAHRLTAHDLRADGVDAVGLNVADI